MSTTFLLVRFLCLIREHLRNKECFLFHLESSFHSWGNQILTSQMFKCLKWCHQMLKHDTWNIFYWITWEVIQSGNEIFYQKNYVKNVAWKLVPGPETKFGNKNSFAKKSMHSDDNRSLQAKTFLGFVKHFSEFVKGIYETCSHNFFNLSTYCCWSFFNCTIYIIFTFC